MQFACRCCDFSISWRYKHLTERGPGQPVVQAWLLFDNYYFLGLGTVSCTQIWTTFRWFSLGNWVITRLYIVFSQLLHIHRWWYSTQVAQTYPVAFHATVQIQTSFTRSINNREPSLCVWTMSDNVLQYQKALFLTCFFQIYTSSGVMAFSQHVPSIDLYD